MNYEEALPKIWMAAVTVCHFLHDRQKIAPHFPSLFSVRPSSFISHDCMQQPDFTRLILHLHTTWNVSYVRVYIHVCLSGFFITHAKVKILRDEKAKKFIKGGRRFSAWGFCDSGLINSCGGLELLAGLLSLYPQKRIQSGAKCFTSNKKRRFSILLANDGI